MSLITRYVHEGTCDSVERSHRLIAQFRWYRRDLSANAGISPVLLDWSESHEQVLLFATARDADLRLSARALERAALQAREVARHMGTAIVVRRGGVMETLYPPPPTVPSTVQEPAPPHGANA